MPRVTFQYAFYRKYHCFMKCVVLKSFDGIVRATWFEATARPKHWANAVLIDAQYSYKRCVYQTFNDARKLHCSDCNLVCCFEMRFHRPRSVEEISLLLMESAPLRASTITSIWGSWLVRNDSRTRRFTRLRRTANLICFLGTTRPSRVDVFWLGLAKTVNAG